MNTERDINAIADQLAKGMSLDEMRERSEKRINPPTPEKTQAERAYWHKVFGGDKTRGYAPAIRVLSQEMEYGAARDIMSRILQARANEITILEKRETEPFKWVFSDAEKEILKNLLRYFINDQQSEYPLNKGLFIYGATGTGKTEMMQCFQKFAVQEGLQKRFEWTNLSETHISAKTVKDYDPIIQNVTMNRCFDEFCRYSGAVIRFGESLDINEAIVEQRYTRWKAYGQFSFFIANVTPNDLPNLVSPMILDRIRGMCASVLFPGKSKRI